MNSIWLHFSSKNPKNHKKRFSHDVLILYLATTAGESDTTSSTVTSDAGIVPMSISLPPSLFKRISERDTNSTGLVFTVYRKSTLFPVSGGRASSNSSASMAAGETTEVGTDIIAANVGRGAEFESLQDPVTIILRLESQINVQKSLEA